MDNSRLTKMELFAFSGRPSFLYKPVHAGCWYILLKLSYQDRVSYGGCEVAVSGKGMDLVKWGACLKSIRSCPVEEMPEALYHMGEEGLFHQQTMMETAFHGLMEVCQQNFKMASGAARHESYRFPSVKKTAHPQAPLKNLSVLHDESVAYYSIF